MQRKGPYSAGALEATASDVVKFRRAVFHSDSISDELRNLVLATGEFPGGQPHHYALGALNIDDFHGHRRIHHNGSIPGFSSQHDYFPDEDITVVVLVSADGAPQSAMNLAVKLLREVFDIPQPSTSTVAVRKEVLEAFAGQYRMRPYRTALGDPIRIVLQGEQLNVQLNDDPENPALLALQPRSQSEFGISVDDETLFRFTSTDGAVDGLEIVSAGGVIPGVRVESETE